jgi:Ca-activated chloride channel family protein
MFGTRLIYVNLDMDQETLEEIAQITSGRYFFATDTAKLETIYEEIGRLEKTEAKIKNYETSQELYSYFALVALGLLMGETAATSLIFKRLT